MATRIKGGAPGHLIVERAVYHNPEDAELAGAALFEFLWEHINFNDVLPAFLDNLAQYRPDLLKDTLHRYEERHRQ